ncbi:hypothetical protein BH09ACT9_BH09ACT9_00280 [soil metagenome]
MIGPKYERKRRRDTKKAESVAAYDAAARRSGGLCEGCGLLEATQMHHRLYRSRSGLDEAQNLFHCCVTCHGIAHSGREGERLGWAIRSGGDPLKVEVTYRGKPGFLTADGKFQSKYPAVTR